MNSSYHQRNTLVLMVGSWNELVDDATADEVGLAEEVGVAFLVGLSVLDSVAALLLP